MECRIESREGVFTMAADVMRLLRIACSYELFRIREIVSWIDSCFDVALVDGSSRLRGGRVSANDDATHRRAKRYVDPGPQLPPMRSHTLMILSFHNYEP